MKLPIEDKITSFYPVKIKKKGKCLIIEVVPIRTRIETFKKNTSQ